MDPWIYIVIFGAAVIVYAYMRPQSTVADKTAVVNDIENALDQFAQELEEDNQQLLRSISGLKRDLEAEINKLSGRVEALEKQSSPMVAGAGQAVLSEAEQPNEEETKPADTEPNIKNRYNHIFELHGKGKSIEYIAKKIGMNKGEVQLIIQLARQEEQFREEG